ncbi:hypothetical protein LJC02_01805 [Breznakia sp. OttesenSCG-928-G09]|nr:hypothetical protein [Breznakia sp. OttesenSCG-928-G09]
MKSKIVCPNCGSDKLVNYREAYIIQEHRKVLKNGKLSKRPFVVKDMYNGPNHLDCEDCGKEYNYCLDKNGKVVIIKELR